MLLHSLKNNLSWLLSPNFEKIFQVQENRTDRKKAIFQIIWQRIRLKRLNIFKKYSIIDVELNRHGSWSTVRKALLHSLIVHILAVYLLAYQPIFYSSQMSKFLESLKKYAENIEKKNSKRLSKVKIDQRSGEYFGNVFKMPRTIGALEIAWPNPETINKYENRPLPKMNA